jgi:hypothetical protein
MCYATISSNRATMLAVPLSGTPAVSKADDGTSKASSRKVTGEYSQAAHGGAETKNAQIQQKSSIR